VKHFCVCKLFYLCKKIKIIDIIFFSYLVESSRVVEWDELMKKNIERLHILGWTLRKLH